MKKILILLIAVFVFSITAQAQLKAYNFSYSDEFGSNQNCYLTLKGFNVVWEAAEVNVEFSCYESQTEKERGTPAKKQFLLTKKGADFAAVVTVLIAEGEVNKLRLIALSDWIWAIAGNTPFVNPTLMIPNLSKW